MKQNYAIIGDASFDLTLELRERFGVDGYLAGYITTPTEEHAVASNEMTREELDAFYASLKANPNAYKTAPLSAEKMAEYFEKFLLDGRDVLGISLSSALSASYNLMVTAKNILAEKYPDRKILIVDSRKYSVAVGLLTIKACELREQGLTIEQAAEALDRIKKTLHQMGPNDDLMWVASKGRISHAKAVFGSLFGVKPLGDFDDSGMVTVLGKINGYEKAYNATVEYIKRTIKNPSEQIIVMATSARKKQVEELAKLIQTHIKPKEILFCNIYPFSGINVGPGVICAYYFGTEITDLKYEKEVMNDILSKKR